MASHKRRLRELVSDFEMSVAEWQRACCHMVTCHEIEKARLKMFEARNRLYAAIGLDQEALN